MAEYETQVTINLLQSIQHQSFDSRMYHHLLPKNGTFWVCSIEWGQGVRPKSQCLMGKSSVLRLKSTCLKFFSIFFVQVEVPVMPPCDEFRKNYALDKADALYEVTKAQCLSRGLPWNVRLGRPWGDWGCGSQRCRKEAKKCRLVVTRCR